MTRPQKATADYFPHYATGGAAGGKTIFTLESKHGNDGYAAWFKILELLTSSENHYFDCRNADNWEFLQVKTRLEESKLSEVLGLLARLEAINPGFWKHRIIRSDNLIKNLSGLYSRRKVNVISNDELAGLLFTETDSLDTIKGLLHTETPASRVNVYKNPQSKVKESKEKESRGEETQNDDLPFTDPLPDLPQSDTGDKPPASPAAKSKKRTVKNNDVDEAFLISLESNTAYAGINIRREYGKMQAWLLTPNGAGKRPTKQRFVNWLNRCEPQLEQPTDSFKQAEEYYG